VQVVAIRRCQQARAVAALAIEAVGLLERRHARPISVAWRKQDAVAGGCKLRPVVQTANHDRARRMNMLGRLALLLAATQTALDGFGHGNRLRDGKGNRGVDRDTAIGSFFEGIDASGRDRNLDLDIRCQLVEMHRLFDQRFAVAVIHRVGLHRQPALLALLPLEDRQHQDRTFQAHFFDNAPGNLFLVPGRVIADQTRQRLLPGSEFFFENVQDNAWIGCGADGAITDRVVQLVDRT